MANMMTSVNKEKVARRLMKEDEAVLLETYSAAVIGTFNWLIDNEASIAAFIGLPEEDRAAILAAPAAAAEAARKATEGGDLEGWRPIETAPKDGTEILIFYPTWNGDDAVVLAVEWDAGRDGMEEIEGTWFCAAYGHAGDGATHWMPLPKPPEPTRKVMEADHV